MDFTQQFFAGNQPYQQQFVAISPLTPSISHSTGSEDFNATSPTEGFHDLANDFPATFDTYGVQFAQQQQQLQQQLRQQEIQHQQHLQQQQRESFPGPPTPPGQQQASHAGGLTHPAVISPTTPQPLMNSTTIIDRSGTDALVKAEAELTRSDEIQQAQSQRGGSKGSNSDDEDLTPAQSRRKAQNRAAQRAFRERKERHVKELEAKLASMEAAQLDTATENEKLKRDLQKISTENEILRATSSFQGVAPGDSYGGPNQPTPEPIQYNPTDFYSNLLANHVNKAPSHRIQTSETGERLLGAGAAWEYITKHQSFRRGLLNIAQISDLLKDQAKCDGQGPVFEERAIREAIDKSTGDNDADSDTLL